MVTSMIGEAKRVFEIEAKAILDLREKIGASFDQAVQLVYGCEGKVVVTGMGKSGHIARKLASTFASTGTPSIFVHPAETSHGDLGMISKCDVLLALSYRGETDEMRNLLQYAKRKGIKIIALTGNLKSSLAEFADVSMDVGVREEACPLGLAPTASTAATLAMGDALAVAVLTKRGFKEEDFAQFHPGGSLGRKLLTRVVDLMHSGDALPLVKPEALMKDVLTIMTSKEVRGVCGVVDEKGNLLGSITDGDIRRRLEKSHNPLNDTASQLMGKKPKVIDQSELAEKALFLMEQFAIQSLFVVDRANAQPNKPLGLLHLQDLLRAKIR